jgi:hypothetical protein
MIKTTENKVEVYVCKYCDKVFKRENSLIVHLCEKKKRWQEKEEKGVRIGFNTYIKFYEYTQHSTKTKTQMGFIKSPYYKAFVKFGRYCVSINAINVNRFVEYVIQQNKKLDYWTSDRLYTEYLSTLTVRENPIDTLTRAITYSMKWAEKQDADSKDMLRHGNINSNCYAVTTGHISPWVLYNCVSGKNFLSELNHEQTEIVWDFINPEIWSKKFKDHPSDVEYITTMLKKAGW